MEFVFTSLMDILATVASGIMNFFTTDFFENLVIPSPITSGSGWYQFGSDSGWFDSFLPGVKALRTTFKTLGALFALLILMFGLLKSMLPDDGAPREHPLSIVGKSAAAVFGVVNAYAILAVIQTPMAAICKEVQELGNGKTAGLSSTIDANDQYSNLLKIFEGDESSGTSDNGYNYPGSSTATDASTSTGIDDVVISFIVMLMLVALTWVFIKLILEMVERFITLGFLFYVSPLPFGMIGSRETSGIFKTYIRMLLCQYVLIMMNFVFLYVFMYAYTSGLAKLTTSGTDMIMFYAIMIAWLRLGARVDELMQSAGLSVARTGAGLGAELVGSVAAVRGTIGAMKGIAKTASVAGAPLVGAVKGGVETAKNNVNTAAVNAEPGLAKQTAESKLGAAAAGADAVRVNNDGSFDVAGTDGEALHFEPVESSNIAPGDMSVASQDGSYVAALNPENMNSDMARAFSGDAEFRGAMERGNNTVTSPAAGAYEVSSQIATGVKGADGQSVMKTSTDSYLNASIYTKPEGASSVNIGGQNMWKVHGGGNINYNSYRKNVYENTSSRDMLKNFINDRK